MPDPSPDPEPSPELVALGAKLRRRRVDDLGRTMEEVGQRADSTMSYIGRVERGEIDLRYTTLLRLLRGYGYAVELVERDPDDDED